MVKSDTSVWADCLEFIKSQGKHYQADFNIVVLPCISPWGYETINRWNPDAIEAELDHTDRNRVRQVYNRTRYWDERVKMADWWSNEISSMLKS